MNLTESYQSMSALLHFGNSVTPQRLEVECFHPSVAVLGELCIPFCSNNFVHVSGRTWYRSVETFDSHYTMLDGGSLASHCSEYVGSHSSSISHSERSPQGQGTKVSAIAAMKDYNCN